MNDALNPSTHSGESSAIIPDAEFIKEFTRHQRPVFLFILSQISNPTEAEEILQETNLVIWNKFEQFEPGTNCQGMGVSDCPLRSSEMARPKQTRQTLFQRRFDATDC